LTRPHKIARIDGGEGLSFQLFGKRLRLYESGLVEGNIALTLISSFKVPIG